MSLRGRHIVSAYLAADTAERIAAAMGDVLDGRLRTVVVVNELFGWRPEVRIDVEPRGGVELKRHDGWVSISFNDDSYSMSIASWSNTRADVDATDVKRRTFVTVCSDGVEIEQHAPAGNRMWWSLTPQTQRTTELAFALSEAAATDDRGAP